MYMNIPLPYQVKEVQSYTLIVIYAATFCTFQPHPLNKQTKNTPKIFFYIFWKDYTLKTSYTFWMMPKLTYYHKSFFPLNVFITPDGCWFSLPSKLSKPKCKIKKFTLPKEKRFLYVSYTCPPTRNIFTTSHHLAPTFVTLSDMKHFSNPNPKIKIFLTLNQNHICSSLLYVNFYVCVQERFSVLWENLHPVDLFFTHSWPSIISISHWA